MPKLRYTGMIKKSGSSANETFATISSGEIISKAKSQKKTVLNAEQKANASGFAELVPLTRDLKRVFRESFPPDSKGTKWSNRFTSLNKKCKGVVTTTKNEPDVEVDPRKHAPEEFTSVIAWDKLIMAEGPLWTPAVAVERLTTEGETYKLVFSQESNIFEGAYAYSNDKVFAIVYHPETHFNLLVRLRDRGESGSTTTVIPGTIPADELKIYSFAKTADGKTTSNSTFLAIGS